MAPDDIQHERPSRRLVETATRVASVRGSRIVFFGSADLGRLDATGRKRWLVQADEVLYLRAERCCYLLCGIGTVPPSAANVLGDHGSGGMIGRIEVADPAQLLHELDPCFECQRRCLAWKQMLRPDSKAVVLRDGKVQHVCDGIAEAVASGTEQYGDEQFIARRIDGSRESDERYLSATHRLRTNLARMWNESDPA